MPDVHDAEKAVNWSAPAVNGSLFSWVGDFPGFAMFEYLAFVGIPEAHVICS
jgi:hypothetical protein